MTKLGTAIAVFAAHVGKASDYWGSTEFHAVCDAALELLEPGNSALRKMLWWRINSELKAFLTNSGFISAMQNGIELEAETVAADFDDACRQEECEVTSLILIDGLALSDEIKVGNASVVPLSKNYLREFFGGVVPEEANLEHSADVAAVRVTSTAKNPPWGIGYFDWEPREVAIQRLSHPWLTYLNLISFDKVSAAGAFQRSSSLIADPLTRVFVTPSLVREPMISEDGTDYDRPFSRLWIDEPENAAKTIATWDKGLNDGKALSHRASTALRLYRRFCADYWSGHVLGYDGDPDTNEGMIIDAVTALEAICLTPDDQRNKGDRLAKLASTMAEADVRRRRALRESLRDLYKLRNAIVHGEAQRPAKDLSDAVNALEDAVRRVLVRFLEMGGDLESVRSLGVTGR